MEDFATTVISNKSILVKAVFDHLSSRTYSVDKADYTIAWNAIEKPAIEILQSKLKEFFPDGIEFKPAKDKNDFPDLEVTYKGFLYSIDVKSVYFASKNTKASTLGKKVSTKKSSANDLGTMFSFAKKRNKYKSQFFLFVRYIKDSDNPQEFKIKDVFFDYYWRIVGQMSDRVSVSYREKDGNLRPKPWSKFEDDSTFYDTEQDFESAVSKTAMIRAKKIITKQIQWLSNEDLTELVNQILSVIEERNQGTKKQANILEISLPALKLRKKKG